MDKNKIRTIYVDIINKFSQYSLSLVLLSICILVIHFFENNPYSILHDYSNIVGYKYLTNIVLTSFCTYALDKFLSKRINTDKNNLKEFVIYNIFIIFVTLMIVLTVFFIDNIIADTLLFKSSYVVILVCGFYTLNKLIFKNAIFNKK